MDKEKAKTLLRLQEVDQEIQRIKRRLKAIERDRRNLLEKKEELNKQKEGIENDLKSVEDTKKRLKEEMEDLERRLEGVEMKIMQVTKDVEYKALLREKSKCEDRLLKIAYELDNIEEKLKELKQKAEETLPSLEREIKDIEEELLDLDEEERIAKERLSELLDTREKVKAEVPEDVLRFYEEAKERFDYKVIAPIQDGSCSGCGTKIPSLLFSEIMRENLIEVCPNCGRYIYYSLD